jgi:hypothetical protein
MAWIDPYRTIATAYGGVSTCPQRTFVKTAPHFEISIK